MLALLLMAALVVPAAPSYAKNESESNAALALREVHKVKVGNKKYCFFVDHYVVFTRAEIESLVPEAAESEEEPAEDPSEDTAADPETDPEADGSDVVGGDETAEEVDYSDLTMEILKRAGLYMKETNCTDKKHKAITAEEWVKKGGSFRLYDEDIASILEAAPEDGKPVKIDMDLILYTNAPADKQPANGYTTFKTTGPRLLYIAIATEEDAKAGEDICKEEKQEGKKKEKKIAKKKVKPAKMPKESEEMLPEYRTINMADRSGEPVEDTLQDGTPVTLEWVEPDKYDSQKEASWIDRIPGRYAGLAVIAAAVTAAAAAIVVIAKRRRKEES